MNTNTKQNKNAIVFLRESMFVFQADLMSTFFFPESRIYSHNEHSNRPHVSQWASQWWPNVQALPQIISTRNSGVHHKSITVPKIFKITITQSCQILHMNHKKSQKTPTKGTFQQSNLKQQ